MSDDYTPPTLPRGIVEEATPSRDSIAVDPATGRTLDSIRRELAVYRKLCAVHGRDAAGRLMLIMKKNGEFSTYGKGR